MKVFFFTHTQDQSHLFERATHSILSPISILFNQSEWESQPLG